MLLIVQSMSDIAEKDPRDMYTIIMDESGSPVNVFSTHLETIKFAALDNGYGRMSGRWKQYTE